MPDVTQVVPQSLWDQWPAIAAIITVVFGFLAYMFVENKRKREIHKESMGVVQGIATDFKDAVRDISNQFDRSTLKMTEVVVNCTAAHARTEKVIEHNTRVIERQLER